MGLVVTVHLATGEVRSIEAKYCNLYIDGRVEYDSVEPIPAVRYAAGEVSTVRIDGVTYHRTDGAQGWQEG